MSNDVTNSPLIIDTAGASVLITRKIWVVAIRWVSIAMVAAGDEAIVTNKHGRVFYHSAWASVASTPVLSDPSNISFSQPLPLDGVIVPTLGGGTLYIYYRDGR